MRCLILLFVSLVASTASAQVMYDPTSEEVRQDSIRALRMAEHEALSQYVVGMAVLSVRQQGDGYVYDIDGQDESYLYLNGLSSLVVRAPGIAKTLVVVEPSFGVAGTFPSSAVLTTEAPAVGFSPAGPQLPFAVTYHTVHVLVCAQMSEGVCAEWSNARPLSGGDGLQLGLLYGPEMGGSAPPAPPAYIPGDKIPGRDD